MELNRPSASYIIPAEGIDLDLLSLRRYQNKMYSISRAAHPIPIWSANRPEDEYYEFVVLAEILGDQKDCKEIQTKQLCHICNIDVPAACLKEHHCSDMHKTFLKIIENAMDRLKMHAVEENHVLTEKSDMATYFCEFCCDCVRKVDNNLHEASKRHEMALEYCEKIKSFQNDYTEKEGFFKKIDSEIKDDDSKELKKKNRKRSHKKKDLLLESHNNKIDAETSTNDCEFIDIGSKTNNYNLELTINEINQDMKVDNTLEKLEKSLKIDIEPSTTANKAENNILLHQNNENVSEIKQDNVSPNMDAIVNMNTWLQEGIKLDNANVEMGVTITLKTGHRVVVSMDNFHGLHRTQHGAVQCRLCRVLVERELEHLADATHMQLAQRQIDDHHCIRRLDGWIWSHCMICNEHIENKEVHVATYNHTSRLREAIIAGTNDTNTCDRYQQTTENYCNVCDIVLPLGKDRRRHRLTAGHKSKELQYYKANKLDSAATQAATLAGTNTSVISQYTATNSHTAVNLQNVAVNAQNTAANSHNRNVQIKINPAVKTNTHKQDGNNINTNNSQPNNLATEVNDVINISKTTKQAKCRICNVLFPNCNVNIEKHLNGKLHKENLSELEIERSNNNQNVINIRKIKLETAKPEVLTNTSKVGPKVNTENNSKLQTKTSIVNPIEVTDNNNAICHICKTQVPNTKSNIDGHLGGRRHSTNLSKLLSDNKIVIQNGEYFCEVCVTRVLNVNILKHVLATGHRNNVGSLNKELTEIMPNPKTPLEIPPAIKETQANKSTNETKTAEDNMISCFICKVKIQNSDEAKKAHQDTDCHLHNVDKVFAAKSGTDNEIDVKVKKMLCLLCNTEVKLSKILAHLSTKHSEIADSLLDDNLKTRVYVYLTESDNFQFKCKYCNYPPFSGKLHALLHMLGERHLRVLAKVIPISESLRDTDKNNINLEDILQSTNNPKDTNLNTTSATNTLLKALEVNETVKSENLTNSKRENAKCDTMHSDVDNCYASKHQDCAEDRAIEDNSQVVHIQQKDSVPEHSKTAATQNVVVKEIESDRTTQVMPSYSQNEIELNVVTNNIKPTNLNEMTCHWCVINSRHSPSDIQLRILELHKAAKIKYGAEDVFEVCTACKNGIILTGGNHNEVNSDVIKENSDKVAEPKQENIGIDKTINETKPSDSRNDAKNENNVKKIKSAEKNGFDAEDQKSASADEKENDILNLPNYLEATDQPDEFTCMYCETKVLITDCNNHKDEPTHVQYIENLITKRKVEKGGHYEFLQDDLDPSKAWCAICDEIFEKTPKHIENHLKLDQHDYRYQKLLEANKIGNVTSNKLQCDCKVCKVCFKATTLIYHINSATHKTNLRTNWSSYGYQSKLVDENVNIAKMFKKDSHIIVRDNEVVYYCDFCDEAVNPNSSTEHIINSSHFDKVKNILSSHQIEIVSEKYYCKCCRTYLDEILFNHISFLPHRLNNNNIKYTRIITKHSRMPNKSPESDEKEGKPKPNEVPPKNFKTCQSIFSMNNSSLFCNVCKLEFDVSVDEMNKHVNSKTHTLLLEVMLSANCIEHEGDDYFCRMCKMDVAAELVMQHIQMYEHHKTLIDMLHSRGKYIFPEKAFAVIKNLADDKIPDRIISHMRNVATNTCKKMH